MKAIYSQLKILVMVILLAMTLVPSASVPLIAQADAGNAQAASSASQSAAPVPFMHRPYYGSRTISSRTTSFVDHDKPWYVNDGIFVRYDGAKWTNVAIGSCVGGVNCYDGHNGYDLNLWYEPVLSVAAGTVIRAGWYYPTNHQASLGLWAAIDHHNGYVTAYGHLSALTMYYGEQVGVQWQVGTSGTSGSSTGPHLHMATYYYGNPGYPDWSATDPFGWTGSYPDPNVVPDNYLWVDNPGTTVTVPDLSATGSAVYPGATLVDDGGQGWSSTGAWSAASASTDIGGKLHYTATTAGSATATATWQPSLPADGYYEVGVYVDDNHASSSWVPYTVYSVDPNNPSAIVSQMVYVDETHIGSFQGPFGWENTGAQWIGLGTYYFRASMPGRVMVNNATGENGPQLSADGMEFVPTSISAPPTPNSYAFALTSDGTPSAMLPASTTPLHMTLENTSNFAWSASGPDAVQVLYRWLNAQNKVVLTGSPTSLPQDQAINASANLTVQVRTPMQPGAYTLQWDLQQGAKTFSQLGAQVKNDAVNVARYSEVFGGTPLPGLLTPGASVQVSVSVQNRGAIPWPASGSAQVVLGYHWLNSSGQAISSGLVSSLAQGVLPADVPPGGSVSIPITLNAPVLAGAYRLVYDLQQQGTWFASQGATPLTQSITIMPNLPKTYYFAEGYTGTGTTEYLALTNPSAAAAHITITYLFSSAAAKTKTYTVAAQSQSVLTINHEVGPNQSVAMIVSGDSPFVAERSMYTQKGASVSATDSLGSSQLSSTWYFAEGNTTYGWNTLLAVLNPSSQPVTLKVTFLESVRARTSHQPGSKTFTVAAHARGTFVLNQYVPNAQFGLAISASQSILVELPEYLVQSPMRGGSVVVGAPSPQPRWYFGAGSTQSGTTERLVLANPNAGWVSAQVQYLLSNGQVVRQSVGIPGQSRVEVNVNAAVHAATHATLIIANGPIVAERQDFFNNVNSVMGSTTVMGATNDFTSWYFARGTTARGTSDTLALANPGPLATTLLVVYYRSNGAPLVKTYTLAAHSRFTVNISADVGVNSTVGVAIYATSPVVAEQTALVATHGASSVYDIVGLGV